MALINCPECGKEISDKAEACPNCGCPINSSRIKNKYMVYMVGYRDTDTAVSAGLKEVLQLDLEYSEVVDILQKLPYKLYECETKEEATLIAKKLDRWWIDTEVSDERGSTVHINTNIPICPKCGSTNIQVVPRKWSILTGIFTNKIDRVCANCKCKF